VDDGILRNRIKNIRSTLTKDGIIVYINTMNLEDMI
jgi:hypothetical protein